MELDVRKSISLRDWSRSMSRQMRVVIKRPDEEIGHSTFVSNNLGNLQKTVDGYIEVVTVYWRDYDFVIICNEEGKLLGLPDNCWLFGEKFVGTLVFCGINGDELTDLPFSFQEYKEMLEEVME